MRPAWEITPTPWGHAVQEPDPVKLDNITLEQFDSSIVAKAALSNQDKQADAIRRADGASFLVSNPWFKQTKTNFRLVDNWLEQNHITWPMYADFAAATEALAGLLDVDEAAYAQHLDGNTPQKFRGTYTKREFNNIDSLIAEERQAVIQAQGVEKQTDLESAFDRIPLEDAQALLKDGERRHQALADGKISAANADAWLTTNPTWRDDTYNGRLMASQLKINGVTGVVTPADYERAQRQLVAAGMVQQNPAALRKQQEQAVLDRAQAAVKTPGSPWDTTSEAEMYELPLDEVRRRASGNYTGSDRF